MLNWSVLLPFHHFSILQRRLRWTWKARSSPMESWTVWAQPAPATWTTTAASRAWPVMRATPPAASNLPSPPRAPPHRRDHHIPAKLACPPICYIHPAMPMKHTHPVSSPMTGTHPANSVPPLLPAFFFISFFCPTLPLHAAQPTFGGVPVRALSRLWTLNRSDQHWHQGPRHRLPIGSNLILKGGPET